jgi:branched-chain amino acid transport system substrate-binding protein
MRVSRAVTFGFALLTAAVFTPEAHAQQCPKGKLRLYTSWPMQGAMLPEGTGMKNGVDLAVAETEAPSPGTASRW